VLPRLGKTENLHTSSTPPTKRQGGAKALRSSLFSIYPLGSVMLRLSLPPFSRRHRCPCRSWQLPRGD
jgi:hypothetical protein